MLYQSLQHIILSCFLLPQTLVMNLFPTMSSETCFQWDMQASMSIASLMKKKRKNLWILFQRTNFIMLVLATIYAKFKSMSFTKCKRQHLCTVSPPVSTLAFLTKTPFKSKIKLTKLKKKPSIHPWSCHASLLHIEKQSFTLLRFLLSLVYFISKRKNSCNSAPSKQCWAVSSNP